jgi:hypothetical protein
METANKEYLKAIVSSDRGYIWIKPFCEYFGINIRHQYRKIKSDFILKSILEDCDFGIIDANGRILLSRKGFIRWINILNINCIDDSLHDDFLFVMNIPDLYVYNHIHINELFIDTFKKLQATKKNYSGNGNEIKRLEKLLSQQIDSFLETK